MEKLKIIGSLTSPFVRAVRAMCEEMQLPYEMALTVFFAKQDTQQKEMLATHNPLMRVPVLLDGQTEVLDSRIILGYLLRHPQARPLEDFRTHFPKDIAEENTLSVIYGIIDAGVLSFIIRNLHAEVGQDSGYMIQTHQRIRQGLAWLEGQATLGESFGIPELLLVAGLEWMAKREVADWGGYAHLCAVHARYTERPSLVHTRMPETA
jgi:glutathione S-transferase